jgi:hypothetical protein
LTQINYLSNIVNNGNKNILDSDLNNTYLTKSLAKNRLVSETNRCVSNNETHENVFSEGVSKFEISVFELYSLEKLFSFTK